MLTQHLRVAVLFTSLLVSFSHNALANDQQGVLSPKQAMEIATKHEAGNVIKTEASEHNGRAVYVIRIVNEGRVRDILVDSLNGKIVTPDKD
ncbi:PepSY domain-containing protein [Neptuniibacter pectenicola]|jgi:uncharacterized membrane protein YkoI|uniref:PepSY domain-containing protein n=1 Tax=Neptuniibacter pectenicola TaxID=1806669 RepID=A0ABU9TUF8_9GAMM|nr:PepSY domain-containing protein [Neptuniibacter pectenicola]KXJ50025.1 MAG: hypothetical protein AXW15_05685 [Neptuniibacter sp. Phe_28]|tara:strand:- start:1375 stop:1650 length:276 start_codon:yes stop_codon:yes gene_type:complete